MILVNNGMRNSYAALKHAEWNGLTPTDLVFPTFLFLVGITIVFSTETRRLDAKGDDDRGSIPVDISSYSIKTIARGRCN